jgi:hypothetical protein
MLLLALQAFTSVAEELKSLLEREAPSHYAFQALEDVQQNNEATVGISNAQAEHVLVAFSPTTKLSRALRQNSAAGARRFRADDSCSDPNAEGSKFGSFPNATTK